MSPTDSRTKVRPQQSCLKCRERKVKCDRSIPCHACIARGIESECTYLTTAEDRAHISQAEIIEQLRREVRQLRGRLDQSARAPIQNHSQKQNQSQSQSQSHNQDQRPFAPTDQGYGYGYGANTHAGAALPDATEHTWRGSSPSSSTTTMTNSMTVTSPDSTGSEGGGPAVSAQNTYPFPTTVTTTTAPYGPQVAEMDALGSAPESFHMLDDPTISACFSGEGNMTVFSGGEVSGLTTMTTGGLTLQPHSVAVQAPLYGADSPDYGTNTLHSYMGSQGDYAARYGQTTALPRTNEEEQVHAYHPSGPWGQDAYAPGLPPSQHSPSPYSSSSIPLHSHPNTVALISQSPAVAGGHLTPASIRASLSSPAHAPSTSWKGQGKQALLETLLGTIGSCDEQQVAQVVQVVRASPTPEAAVSGVCQVLGIGGVG
ncbi:transcriptional regulator family: Fungal Specific TF [Penicillium alfredii]|uniref:Transcriptional regulator family: Fungal Specific TF n=1 Tax=Penicillium alfredii TaxID=1506179 RepID=A0A9W9FKX5_9EURO|nr:transcriptional regulator family: Fungal Specific TF [Penicillium alfredii]KAJ5102057.1 transcriptional regulator family: Fungal Specific TF [Penicillium alfredii]